MSRPLEQAVVAVTGASSGIGRGLEILYALAPPLYRRLARRAFIRGTMPAAPAAPSAGNVRVPVGPYAIEGGWRLHRRATLRRAFFAAALGALAGLAGRAPRRRGSDRARAWWGRALAPRRGSRSASRRSCC